MSRYALDEPEDVFWHRLGIPSQGDQLLILARSGFPFVIFERLTRVFQLDAAHLGKLLSISSSTLRRRRLAGYFNPQESDRIFRAAMVLRQVSQLFEGNVGMAKLWMSTPQVGLGGRLPREMFSTAIETRALLNVIGRIEYGVLS